MTELCKNNINVKCMCIVVKLILEAVHLLILNLVFFLHVKQNLQHSE